MVAGRNIQMPVASYPRKIEQLAADQYNLARLSKIEGVLQESNTLTLKPQSDGLFPASTGAGRTPESGYQDIWLRDNVMIASSFFHRGETAIANAVATGLTQLLKGEKTRFEAIIRSPSLKTDVQGRPHVRFRLGRQPLGDWSHAQNDALGYVLWLRFMLANAGKLDVGEDEFELYRLFPRYFEAIEYWSDLDSGAWEEERKINSSSIGAVLAGLHQLRHWLLHPGSSRAQNTELLDLVSRLIANGNLQLKSLLPFESPPSRKADAALLLLIYPDQVLDREQEDSILMLVEAELKRGIGTIRYIRDSYYGQDYDDWFGKSELTSDFSDRIEVRNAKLRPGFEAQWCMFDSLISVIHGSRFLASPGDTKSHELQTLFFNRSLRQLTPEMQCPELYYYRHGTWTPNPHTPLAWTQANLALALHLMKKAVSIAARS